MEDEKTLVIKVQNGDLSSFEILLNNHSSNLRAFVAMKLPVPHLIDEVAHETFVFAHRHIQEFEAGTDFGKWLRAIAFNLVRSQTLLYKRANKNKEKYCEYLLVEGASQPNFGPEPAVIAYLEECLNQLTDEQKGLLDRKYKLAESSKEMAAALDKSEAWVRTTLCRLRASLRSCIEKKVIKASTM